MKNIQFTLIVITISLAAALTGPKQVFGTTGGAVTIRCQYCASYYKYHEKYLCKGSEWKSCSIIAHSQGQQENIDNRIIIVDNQTSGEFFTTMTQLSTKDTGHYWCGITITGYDRMVKIQLNVIEAPTTPSPTLPYEPLETVHQANQSTTDLCILLGLMFGILIIAAIFIRRCRKYSAVGEKGFRYIEEESNSSYAF
ncbi:CMRF35-like molecule 5 [Pristis pectinata]|uniref:CMRF35-like molecule 5 n=1 Tax=Pristis pectinata TaxID=685728 RepID=UPI00223CF037|nr:CMRF35-like molecule 5 [Pristis pectinata]